MEKATTIDQLRKKEAAIRALGATSLYLFGSTARDEARPDSDIDLFVEYQPGFTLFDLAGIKVLLEGEFTSDVHVTTRDSLHPLKKKQIERDAIRVF